MNETASDRPMKPHLLWLDRLEKFYLAAVRVVALLGATALLLWAAWFIVTGLYQLSRDADSVKPVPASVSTEEVLAIETSDPSAAAQSARANPVKQQAKAYYDGFVGRYYALYQSKFAPFRQQVDKPLTRAQFDQRFVRSSDRLAQFDDGLVSFESERADLEGLLSAMTTAADTKQTTDRLNAYKKAKREKVSRTIRSTRTEAYCAQYGYYIDACISYDYREVPQVRTITETRLPKGVIAPADLLHAYQDKYFTLLVERRDQNAAKAVAEREEIEIGNEVGAARLWTAIYVVGAFVALMFLFLLIAIERHQRRIARATPAPGTEES